MNQWHASRGSYLTKGTRNRDVWAKLENGGARGRTVECVGEGQAVQSLFEPIG